ncbi:MAG: DUF4271 domain-containing protein [Alistipes sp.]|nr:DUF4271 domain-containing protein [Alistipes sp.]MBQ8917033.1 DUF4271 domain-containing protein [Alistipes sp.]
MSHTEGAIDHATMTIDTVATAVAVPIEVDSTSFLWPHYTTLDSLRTHAPHLFRSVSPEALFGVHSEQASIPFAHAEPHAHTATTGFGLLVVALLCLYATLLYRHIGDVRLLLAHITLPGSSGERLQEDSGSSFSRFLTICGWLGIVLAGASIIYFTNDAIPNAWMGLMPQWSALVAALGVILAILVLLIYQTGITALIGLLTFSQPLIEQLWMVKRLLFALLTILCAPPLLLLVLTPQGGGGFWLWIVVSELLISLVLYLHETRMLFISKKISILHWFLYLCTVEIFPISLLWLLALRHA